MTERQRIAALEAEVRDLRCELELMRDGQGTIARRLGQIQAAIRGAVPVTLPPERRAKKLHVLRQEIARRQREIGSKYARRR